MCFSRPSQQAPPSAARGGPRHRRRGGPALRPGPVRLFRLVPQRDAQGGVGAKGGGGQERGEDMQKAAKARGKTVLVEKTKKIGKELSFFDL